MFQTQLIQQVVEWEHRLHIEEEKRENLRGEPYHDITIQPQPVRKERRSILARIFKPAREPRPVRRSYPQNPCGCGETQTGC